ncbi:MAG: UDP-3-O-(3-hydroxymyristoyl)glucosamine N-acyltransferase [Alphaproteobacteria bacterium]|nr:UDP-3-O-(3-hydroxymyristoyl)glucosamine N-acyltransferase [Alphaproteobacteria bacterium]
MAGRRQVAGGGPFSLDRIAAAIGCRIADSGHGGRLIEDVATLETAGPEHLGFYDHPRYREVLAATRAGAVVLAESHVHLAPAGTACLISSEPYRAFALAAAAFHPEVRPPPGIAPGAHIDPTALLGAGVHVAPGAVIEAGVSIGAGSVIGPCAVIGAEVALGEGCHVGAHASLYHCRLGDRVRVYPGARIGQDGFGFVPDRHRHLRMPQLGRVIIGNDCEIGANSTIDRGSLGDTVIGDNVWIDNLVQIGHNVRIGRGAILVAQVGIAGSSRIGEFARLGGQAGIAGHLTIGPGASIAAQSGVATDVPAGETWFGTPAQRSQTSFREIVLLRRLARRREN